MDVIAQKTACGETSSVGRNGGERIDRTGSKGSAWEDAVDHAQGLRVASIQISPPEGDALPSGNFCNGKIVEIPAVGRNRGAGGAEFIGHGRQRAAFDVTEEELMFGIQRITPMGMSISVQKKTLGIRRENLRLHVNVAGGGAEIVRELKDFETCGGFGSKEIGAGLEKTHWVQRVTGVISMELRFIKIVIIYYSSIFFREGNSFTGKNSTFTSCGVLPTGRRSRICLGEKPEKRLATKYEAIINKLTSSMNLKNTSISSAGRSRFGRSAFYLSTFFCLLLSLIGLRAASSNAGTVNLVEDGQVRAQLFLPKSFGPPLELAQKELRDYFQKITGQELPVSDRTAEALQKGDLGIRLVVRDEKEWKGKESAQAFVIEETATPTAESPLTGVTIMGNTEMAVLYGVYQYLEDQGVRWFTPGEIGENVPEKKTIAIAPRRQEFSPSFLERGLDLSGTGRDHFDVSDKNRYRDEFLNDYALWRLRNRLMFERSINSGVKFDFNRVVKASGHAIRPAVLKGADFAQEPERFPMFTKDGETKRWEKVGQICFTNEKNVQSAVDSAVAFFENQEATRKDRNTDLDEIMDCFPMGLSDSNGICACPECTKVAGQEPNSRDRLVWSFYNQVARGLNKRLPGKKIGLYAPYFELTRPPADVKIEPNIVAVSCRAISWSAAPEDASSYPFTKSHKENTEATKEAGAEMQVYNYSTWQGTPQILSLLDTAEADHAMGVQYFHTEVMNRNEQIWPILWVLAQYTWDSSQQTRDLLKTFTQEYYGKKGGKVVLDLMERLDANSRTLPRIVYGGLHETQWMMGNGLAEEGRRQLSDVINQAKGKEKPRLERFLVTWEMFAHSANVYQHYTDALNERTPESIQLYQKALAEAEQFWTKDEVAETCSPRVLATLKGLGEVTPTVTPVGLPELKDEKIWKRELFAFDEVPKTIPNLFPLPEVWKFRIDNKNLGLEEGWEKVAYDDRAWNGISTWNTFERQGYKGVDGRFWYRTKFQAPDFPKGKTIMLRFGSLDDDGDIYINGKLAHSRHLMMPDDWQTSFAFDVTDLIQPGKENVIAVRGYDGFGAGGVWRPVALYTE